MMSEFNGILTVTVFLPALAALIILIVKPLKLDDRIVRWFAILSTVAAFVLSLAVFLLYDRDAGGVQMVDHLTWLSAQTIKSSYLLGVDGLSAPLVLLTGILGMAAAFASRNIDLRVSEYFMWLLLLEAAVMGVFVSLDLLLFFVFFEFEVIPMFMLISVWGTGRPRYSAMKFVLFTLAGGAFMFVGIFAVYLSGAVETLTMVPVPELGIAGIADQIAGVDLIAPASLIFAFFLVAFAVKLPVWPLHNWLPDAHTDAPTAVSVMLAGVLLKMAGYGMIRINIGFFQETKGFTVHDAAGILSVVAAVSVVYGAIVTIRQTDMKRLIAYSSVSHMGFVLLGLTAIGGGTAAHQLGGGQWRGVADVHTRYDYRTRILDGRDGLRPNPHSPHPALGRIMASNAGHRYLLFHRRIRFARTPRVVRVRFRDHGFPQLIPSMAMGSKHFRVRGRPCRGLHPLDDPKDLLRNEAARRWDSERQIRGIDRRRASGPDPDPCSNDPNLCDRHLAESRG